MHHNCYTQLHKRLSIVDCILQQSLIHWYGKQNGVVKNCEKMENMFIRFDRVHERDEQTDRHRMMALAVLA